MGYQKDVFVKIVVHHQELNKIKTNNKFYRITRKNLHTIFTIVNFIISMNHMNKSKNKYGTNHKNQELIHSEKLMNIKNIF